LNYSFVEPENFKIIEKAVPEIDSKPVLVFPLPQRYGGTIPDDANLQNEKKDDGLHAFGFNVN
jgi:hypothetical protein